MMPSSKLLYSSDQVYEPELFWLPARFARRALELQPGNSTAVAAMGGGPARGRIGRIEIGPGLGRQIAQDRMRFPNR